MVEQPLRKRKIFGSSPKLGSNMVNVAQLVESRIVIPVVAGSSPVVHPIFISINISGIDRTVSILERWPSLI